MIGENIKRRSQGTPEYMMAISFMLLVFLFVTFMMIEKQNESYDFKVFLDAKRVGGSVADNINTIAQQGHGYYRYISVPEKLYGELNYDILVGGAFLEINWSNQNWAANLITSNVTLIQLEKGEDMQNCVYNYEGNVIVNDVCGNLDLGCGRVQSCDPGDFDTCPTCFTPEPPEIYQNGISNCGFYGCNTSEWHFYKVIPDRDGRLKVTLRGTGSMTGDEKTDLMIYYYTDYGCNNPVQNFNLERQSSHIIDVEAGKTYVIGLDVDSPDCGEGGAYWLKTELK